MRRLDGKPDLYRGARGPHRAGRPGWQLRAESSKRSIHSAVTKPNETASLVSLATFLTFVPSLSWQILKDLFFSFSPGDFQRRDSRESVFHRSIAPVVVRTVDPVALAGNPSAGSTALCRYQSGAAHACERASIRTGREGTARQQAARSKQEAARSKQQAASSKHARSSCYYLGYALSR